jgi:hypothetical protein
MVTVEKLVDWRLAGETEVLGENLPHRHFVHNQSHMARPGKPVTNRLSYGAANLAYRPPEAISTVCFISTSHQALKLYCFVDFITHTYEY